MRSTLDGGFELVEYDILGRIRVTRFSEQQAERYRAALRERERQEALTLIDQKICDLGDERRRALRAEAVRAQRRKLAGTIRRLVGRFARG